MIERRNSNKVRYKFIIFNCHQNAQGLTYINFKHQCELIHTNLTYRLTFKFYHMIITKPQPH